MNWFSCFISSCSALHQRMSCWSWGTHWIGSQRVSWELPTVQCCVSYYCVFLLCELEIDMLSLFGTLFSQLWMKPNLSCRRRSGSVKFDCRRRLALSTSLHFTCYTPKLVLSQILTRSAVCIRCGCRHHYIFCFLKHSHHCWLLVGGPVWLWPAGRHQGGHEQGYAEAGERERQCPWEQAAWKRVEYAARRDASHCKS